MLITFKDIFRNKHLETNSFHQPALESSHFDILCYTFCHLCPYYSFLFIFWSLITMNLMVLFIFKLLCIYLQESGLQMWAHDRSHVWNNWSIPNHWRWIISCLPLLLWFRPIHFMMLCLTVAPESRHCLNFPSHYRSWLHWDHLRSCSLVSTLRESYNQGMTWAKDFKAPKVIPN